MVRDEQKFKDWKNQKQLRPEQDWHKSLWGRIHEFGGGGGGWVEGGTKGGPKLLVDRPTHASTPPPSLKKKSAS